MRNYDFDGEPFVVVERNDSGVGTFLLGAILGAGVALLFAPRSGAATRRLIGARAREASDVVRESVANVADTVTMQAADVRDQVVGRVGSARQAVRRGQYHVLDAIDAGRSAAIEARAELERKIAENKASRREANGA